MGPLSPVSLILALFTALFSQGHEFEIAIRYGEHLTAIFVCWLFSSGMPLMYWSCFFSFLLHYWSERYELLRVGGRLCLLAGLQVRMRIFVPLSFLLDRLLCHQRIVGLGMAGRGKFLGKGD